jgi:ribokinase
MNTAVVGHVEWVQFVRVDHLPQAGEIIHATEFWEEAAGGGSGAASQLLKLAGNARLFTALGDDDIGEAARSRLDTMGIELHDATRSKPTRRAVTFVDTEGERTITVIGRRLNPHAADQLPWEALDDTDTCYFTAGDAEALRMARRSRILVATARVLEVLAEARVSLDALVGSAADPSESYGHGDLDPVPRLVVRTNGEFGGSFSVDGGVWQKYEPVPLRAPIVDRYGAGDSFAAGLGFGLAAGLGPGQAVALAARCGVAVLAGRGPYATQLTHTDVKDLIGGKADSRSI